MKLDDLADRTPQSSNTDPLAAFRAQFTADFGEINGEFAMEDTAPVVHMTFQDRPVTIRGQQAPSGVQEYVINGNLWHPPGDFVVLEQEHKQALFAQALRLYV